MNSVSNQLKSTRLAFASLQVRNRLPRECVPLLAAVLVGLSASVAKAQEPMQIRPDTIEAVKQATALLRVTRTDGKVGQASGFLTVEPGVLVTNAHVVGMKDPKSQPPSKIEVILHSGEPSEFRLTGQVLGVDRVADLAVLKVEGKGKLPASLQLGVKDKLYETQKLYIFGFPFEKELGKNITVSESSISSLRKDASGALEKIQVNGGMHPGNSGGPVTNAQGHVVAVSVGGLRGTQINFAIPAASVQAFLEGGIQEVNPGEIFHKNGETSVAVQYECLDPLQRIREVRVEVWAGKPDAKRPFSANQAKPQEGDGPRRSVALKYAKSVASAEVPLPKLAPGQVAWVQPVLVLAKGERWGQPHAFDCSVPWIVQKFQGHNEAVRSVFLSGDGKYVLSGSRDKTAILWDAASGKQLQVFRGHTGEIYGVALSGDGKHVVTGSTDSTAILWEAASGKKLLSFQGHKGPVWSLTLSGDSSKVLTGAGDSTAILWDTASGKQLQTFRGHTDQVRTVALSSDGKHVLTGSFDKTAILWEASSGKKLQIYRGHTDEVSCVSLSADGRYVAASSEIGKHFVKGSPDRTAMLWEAASGKKLQTFEGHTGPVLSVALFGDGKRLFTGSGDKTAILWNAATGKKLQTLRGHTEAVHAVALSRDGKLVLTGSSDHTAILWQIGVSPPPLTSSAR